MDADHEEKRLRQGLERWREDTLNTLAKQMLEINEDLRDAQNGLAIAHRNPGQVAADVVDYLWEKLNLSAAEVQRREEEHDRWTTMGLPDLITEANRHAARGATTPEQEVLSGPAQDHGQVENILRAWRDILEIQLEPKRLRAHLDTLNTWQQQLHKWRHANDVD